ncbi:hypothetical protein [Actinokineospora sp. NBRC 105648]|uniref:hypothetical protein n=1 Tax=Actinokineospora sp. NBRC 105648 TaxID=3032206 RepID=UPI0024A212BC|nr:hypothetical protein [Actinokineospora sp. NBRC 105648]GLZ42264.1 hypothetical protein Acsp05_58880 [Actinokineospora sp. NBRC 105648]
MGLIPAAGSANGFEVGISWNHTTRLDIAFLTLAAAFVIRFLRTGGRDMLNNMGGTPVTDGQVG